LWPNADRQAGSPDRHAALHFRERLVGGEHDMATQTLSDKGLSIITFAAYHALTSGERVAEVTIRDGSGHRADPDGLREVQSLGLAVVEGDKAVLTDSGKALLDEVLQQLRGTIKTAERQTAVA
jgi:hypothetical protein